MKQNGLLARHDTAVVQSFWQDLLTEAAIYERKPALTFEASNTIEIAKFGSQFVPAAISANEATKRPRRIEPISAKRISALREEYVGLIERDYSKQNTKLKLIRGVDQFIRLMEDPPLQSIKAKTVYDYIDRQLEIRKDASNKTLSNYHWGISKLIHSWGKALLSLGRKLSIGNPLRATIYTRFSNMIGTNKNAFYSLFW